MVKVARELSEISTRTKDEITRVERELKKMPKGRLTCEKHNGKLSFVKETYRDGKRRRKSLAPQDPELTALIKKELYTSESNCLQNNSLFLEQAINNVKDFDLNYTIYELRKRLPLLTDEILLNTLSDEANNNWANQDYEKYQYQDDNTKWQMSTFGMRFRSKSELLIAEMLHKYDVQFRYEQVLHFEDTMLAPDFTIKRGDGKIIYWEHEGLTNSADYLNRQIKKHQIYAMNHIVPWDNFIVTYDSVDGMIDLRIVESEIKNKIL